MPGLDIAVFAPFLHPVHGLVRQVEGIFQAVAFGSYRRPDGEDWIGFTSLTLYPDREGAYNRIPSVLPSYRGRRIALALKFLAVRYARQHGATHLDTFNDSFNTSMLAVNRKMGYQPKPGICWLRRNLWA
jgi:RimJ/RimL family protein N-acetyltransferase